MDLERVVLVTTLKSKADGGQCAHVSGAPFALVFGFWRKGVWPSTAAAALVCLWVRSRQPAVDPRQKVGRGSKPSLESCSGSLASDRKKNMHATLSSIASPLSFSHLRKGPIFSCFWTSGVCGDDGEAASCAHSLTSTQAPGSPLERG